VVVDSDSTFLTGNDNEIEQLEKGISLFSVVEWSWLLFRHKCKNEFDLHCNALEEVCHT